MLQIVRTRKLSRPPFRHLAARSGLTARSKAGGCRVAKCRAGGWLERTGSTIQKRRIIVSTAPMPESTATTQMSSKIESCQEKLVRSLVRNSVCLMVQQRQQTNRASHLSLLTVATTTLSGSAMEIACTAFHSTLGSLGTQYVDQLRKILR